MLKLKHGVLTLLILTVVGMTFSCIPRSDVVGDFWKVGSTNIRVLIDKRKVFRLFSTGRLLFVEGIPLEREISVSLDKTNIVVNGITLGERVDVYSDGNIIFDGIEYSGFFRLVAEGSVVMVINVVELEEYLESVVPSEVPALWPMEVLKAQAIVSRTYALRRILDSKGKEYDVLSSYKSQVYSGVKKVHERTSRAVRETRGVVITYKGEIISAFFHANSGGLIESPEVIGARYLPYLKPSVDRFSQDTYRSFWSTYIPKGSFLKGLFGNDNLKLVAIEIPYRMPSGSVREIRVTATDGKDKVTVEIDVNRFREVFPSVLSPKFEIETDGYGITFKGYGWGHGVGMSQWGAKAMADQGYNYREIIKYYYKDVDIENLY
ncbi:MAG: SpoIID/LytB domain-containing protein [Brevinematia bacterium]